MDASGSTSEAGGPVSLPGVSGSEIDQPNVLALEYLRDPSSSSIAMMRNAFKGLLDTDD